jgi:P-type Mg2+ transporter
MVASYLVLIEFGKRIFYRRAAHTSPSRRRYSHMRSVRRRATRFSHTDRIAHANTAVPLAR